MQDSATSWIRDSPPRKDIDVLRKMIRSICDRDRPKDPDVWGKNPLPRSGGKRNAFSIAFVRDTLLAPGALNGMEPVARGLLYVLADTGARVSEVLALRTPTIKLAHNIPHIAIHGDGRQVKSKDAIRCPGGHAPAPGRVRALARG